MRGTKRDPERTKPEAVNGPCLARLRIINDNKNYLVKRINISIIIILLHYWMVINIGIICALFVLRRNIACYIMKYLIKQSYMAVRESYMYLRVTSRIGEGVPIYKQAQ